MLFNMVLPGAVEVVPPDENTLLLLHGEDLTDGSIYGHTVTNNGVSVSTAQSKYGGKSLYFNGSSRLSISPVSLFEFGTGDWTFDAWVYPLSQSNDNFFFSGAANGALFIGRQSGNGTLGIGRANVAWDNAITSTLILNTWNHVAYVKSSGKIYYFVNGKLAGSANNAISYGILGGVLNIGSQGTNYYYNGYMDEVRMSNVARWTENFTPPTEPYNPNGSGSGSTENQPINYTGNYTDNRTSNKGTVRFNTSGTWTVTEDMGTVFASIIGAGGGAARNGYAVSSSGGGGGNQTVEVELTPGTYEIVIGTGGTSFNGTDNGSGGKGGNTTAFGFTSTGGDGGDTGFSGSAGGSPNGNAGQNIMYTYDDVPGGSPNGGGIVNATAQPGGDGYVEITFI